MKRVILNVVDNRGMMSICTGGLNVVIAGRDGFEIPISISSGNDN